MRAALVEVVAEPVRRAELLAQVTVLEGVLQEQNQELTRLAQTLQALNSDFDTPRERFETELAQFRLRVDARFERVQAAHFELARRLDANEWKRVVELEHAALEAAGMPDLQEIRGGKS
jgi:nitric oxide reductase activation protein